MKAPFAQWATNPRTIPQSIGAFQRRRCGARTALLSILLALSATLPDAAAATTAAQLCPGSSDPCVVSSTVPLDPNSTIDLGSRGLRISGNGQLRIQSGTLTLRCAALTIDANASIRSTGARRDVAAASVSIEASSVNLIGRIDSRGSPAGTIELTADGQVLISGEILGRAEAGDTSAATVDIVAATATLAGDINLGGGREDVGGDLTVAVTASLIVTGTATLDVSGGEGGSIDLSSEGTLRIDPGAELLAQGQTIAEDAGSVTIAAVDLLTMHGSILATARQGDEENGGGDGGTVSISSENEVDLLRGDAKIDASGGAPDGIGGDIEIEATFGRLRIAAALVASVAGGDGLGGSIDLAAGDDFLFLGSADARGGSTGGGDIDLDSDTNVTIAAGAILDASGVRTGSGGSIGLLASETLTVSGQVRADGGNAEGSGGGTTDLRACQIDIAQSALVTTNKPSGRNGLTCRTACTVAGQLRADPATGRNEIRYRAGGAAPQIGGSAVIAPAAVLVADANLQPCGPIPPTATPTATFIETATSPASPTPTPTPTLPPACPGDCDRNNRVDIAELVRAVGIALGRATLDTCPAADRDGNGSVAINELIAAVRAALDGCP